MTTFELREGIKRASLGVRKIWVQVLSLIHNGYMTQVGHTTSQCLGQLSKTTFCRTEMYYWMKFPQLRESLTNKTTSPDKKAFDLGLVISVF